MSEASPKTDPDRPLALLIRRLIDVGQVMADIAAAQHRTLDRLIGATDVADPLSVLPVAPPFPYGGDFGELAAVIGLVEQRVGEAGGLANRLCGLG